MNRPPLESSPIMPVWANWFTSAWRLLNTIEASGPTSKRPVSNLFIGMTYFDTTLNKPIWLKSFSAGVSVWIDATGTSV